ncbi:MAG: hypothetical protein SNG27_07085 [Rikenellaceae bacterium]
MSNSDKKLHYVYILDYAAGTISAFDTTNIENIEEQLLERGYKESRCSWMVTTEQLEIEWME